jgi:hypothetical protein
LLTTLQVHHVHFNFKKLARVLDGYFLDHPYREDEAREILVEQVREEGRVEGWVMDARGGIQMRKVGCSVRRNQYPMQRDG